MRGKAVPSASDGTPALAALAADCSAPLTSLAALPDPQPEENNPAALFKRGWLRKGGGAFLIAPSGVGKSVFTVQAATLWAMGKAAFRIEPVRPLKIVIIQAEDDAEEMADFRNQIVKGLEKESGLDPAAINDAIVSRVLLYDVIGATADEFIMCLDKLVEAHPEIDLLIVNPFQSYFGGEITRNSEVTAFLRGGIDPVIKPKGIGRVGILFVHHTNKPPNSKDRANWGTDFFSSYIGAGGAELVNWARATLALMPVENLSGMFKLVAGKRGSRLEWTDSTGARVNHRLIAHHGNGLIFWRDATEEEELIVIANTTGRKPEGDPTADATTLAEFAKNGKAKTKTEIRKFGNDEIGDRRTRRALKTLLASPATFGVREITNAKTGHGFVGRSSEVDGREMELGIK